MYDGADPARGRIVLLAHMTLVVALSATVIAIYLTSRLPLMSPQQGQQAILVRAGRFLLTILLMCMLYRGSAVAWWLSVVLFGLAMLIVIPMALMHPSMWVMVAIYGGFTGTLLFSADVLEFLDQQQRRRQQRRGDQVPTSSSSL